MQVGYNQKGTYKAGVSYVLAYQVHNNSWSSFNTNLTQSTPLPFQSQVSILGSIYHHLHTITIPHPYHRSIDRPTPSRHYLKARSPWLRLNTHPRGRKRKTHLTIYFKRNPGKVHSRQVGICIDRSTIHSTEVLHNHKICFPR